jgi:tetratricopeptide (TPR) repeat protein
MATYKKRGYKPKKEKIVSDVEETIDVSDSTTAEVFNTLDESASKTEAWVEKNQKAIFGVIIAIAVLSIGYLLYQKFVNEPNQLEASSELFQAQSFYEKALTATEGQDSLYRLALGGRGGKYGFEDIADKYSGTASGNLANFYAGMSHLNTQNYDKAIQYLDSYKGSDEMTGAQAQGGIGDAFAQLGQKEEALKYYNQASTSKSNDVITPRYALKAGLIALELGNKAEALKHFSNIVANYKESTEFKKAEIYKAQAEAMQ